MGMSDNPRPDVSGRKFEGSVGAEAEADLGRLGKDAVDAAASLYRDGRDLFSNSPELAMAAEDLRHSIRRSPLAAMGVAFTAGLLLALLTRG